MKKLFIHLLSLCAIVSCLQEERSPDEILVPTPAQVECSDESLMLTSKVPSGSEKLVQDCGFYFSKDKSMTDVRKIEGVWASNNFTAELPERAYGSTYYICSYVTNGHGSEIRSDLRSYTLDELDDYVKFGSLNMLAYDKNNSTLEITIDADIWGGVKIAEIGVCYGDAPTGLDVDGPHKVGVWSRTQTKGDAGVVTISIDGLSDATQYYFRGYLKDEDYISYGDVSPFYIPAIPAVQTGAVEDITPYTAVLYGEVLDECGSPVTERGFVLNEGTVAPAIDSDKIVVDGSLGVMTATAEGLLPNKTYTFSAYAVNTTGVAYGAPVTFTTLVALPDLAAAEITAVTSNSATFGGTVINDGGETVSEVGFYYSTDPAVDPKKSEKVSQEYSAYQRTVAGFAANTLYSAMSDGAPESESDESSEPAMSKASGAETKAASDGYKFSIDVYGLTLKTGYYVKPYAVNSAGVAYGKISAFETIGEIPTVKTIGSSDVTTSSVVLSGEVVSENGEKIKERGFVWMEGSGVPTTEASKIKVDGAVGAFTSTVRNLKPNQEYTFRTYAINAEGTAYGDPMIFTTLVALPTVTPPVVSSVTSTSATLSGTVKDHGGEIVYEVGFYYSTDSKVDPSSAHKTSQAYSSTTFSMDVAELAINTKYYVIAFATNSAGTYYSQTVEFATAASSPSVVTVGASEITESSVFLSGEVESDNGAAVTERGFVWVKGAATPTTSSSKLKVDGTTGEFSASLSNLDPNQNYSFRAYAINSKGTAYGATLSFTTVVGLPSASATTVSSVTATSAAFSSRVESDGGETVSEVGFYYSADETFDASDVQKVTLPYSNNLFSAAVNDLSICTKYYVKSYVKNSKGEVCGPVTSFTTLASIPEVNTLGSSEITSTSALLSGTVETDNGSTISERGFVWIKGTEIPTTSANKLKVGGMTGEYTASLNDLEPKQKYSFRAYAVNSIGTAYGDVMTFTTVAGIPSLSATGVSNITTTSATFTSTVTSHGGEIVDKVGFYYSTSETIDIETAFKVEGAYVEDKFSYTVEGLAVGTLYNVIAFARNSAGEVTNEVVNFKTVSSEPTVVTKDCSEVASFSVKLSGDVVLDNGETITERGFLLMKGEGTPTESDKKIRVGAATGEYSASVSELDPNQKYSYRAYAVNSKGTAYGETKSFTTLVALPEVVFVAANDISSSTAIVSAKVAGHGGEIVSKVGVLYGTSTPLDPETSANVAADYTSDDYSLLLEGLRRATDYYVQPYAVNTAGTSYGDVVKFTTMPELPVVTTADIAGITESGAQSGGFITDDGGGEILAKGIVWNRKENPTLSLPTKTNEGEGNSSFTSFMSGLISGTTYYVRAYATNAAGTAYGEQKEFMTHGAYIEYLDPANCFIVSQSGSYIFAAVKGESTQSVGDVSSVEVLWETFGTEEVPETGALIKSVSYNGGMVTFTTPNLYCEGNALIAAKDASGTILWSWHVWFTDQPEEQVYNNYAGIMMDRNLGATSATPGDVGALGLLYQWGRKDPFLGSSSIHYEYPSPEANSTASWPAKVYSNASNGTIDYAIENPMTFIVYNSSNSDWYYTGSSSTDDTRWHSEKTIYDPCPSGWRVPDGGSKGVWAMAGFSDDLIDSSNEGMSFEVLGSSQAWYPAAGGRTSGELENVGRDGYCWSVTPTYVNQAYALYYGSKASCTSHTDRARALSVRCFKEVPIEISDAKDLSSSGTANSYIVTRAGTYSIAPVKGNSNEPVGSIESVEVLWEAFGSSSEKFIYKVVYQNGKIYFMTHSKFVEGNAVIAAKDASGTILWSWHIWVTDEPKEHVYNNNAGIMMDRNLGATSDAPDDVANYGLFYQWGRKDPFLGASALKSSYMDYVAPSTITWPSPVSSDESTGTIEYTISHPTTFIKYNKNNTDWYFGTDHTRWQSEKTIYDPCPPGWRVPDGGEYGVWKTAGFPSTSPEDNIDYGAYFSISSPSSTWYPVAGNRNYGSGSLDGIGYSGAYWSVTTSDNPASTYARSYALSFDSSNVFMTSLYSRASGFSIRCLKEGSEPKYDNTFSVSGAKNLSSEGTANSYVVSKVGTYRISAVKGNSNVAIGSVTSAEVLWESYGTDKIITKGQLIKGAKYQNGNVYFKTSDTFKEGNAVIAVKDASGAVLWSWHIWLTDQPQEQVYNNNAGIMMDRNLGATSATSGDAGALGLLYQWGRKDPFLGSSSISSDEKTAKSTTPWPSPVSSDSQTGTIGYATAHPTTFIIGNDSNYDWYYTGTEITDNTRWQSEKTIYDPCPLGWRVPDGGNEGVWSVALGPDAYDDTYTYDDVNEGIDLSGKFGVDPTIWYPASGYRTSSVGTQGPVGTVTSVANYGYYWSVTPNNHYAYGLRISVTGYVNPSYKTSERKYGYNVRCLQVID